MIVGWPLTQLNGVLGFGSGVSTGAILALGRKWEPRGRRGRRLRRQFDGLKCRQLHRVEFTRRPAFSLQAKLGFSGLLSKMWKMDGSGAIFQI